MTININPPAPATPPNPANATCAQIRALIKNQGVQLVKTYNTLMALVNANPWGLTSDQVYTALGTDDANTLKNLAGQTKGFVNTAFPNTITDNIPAWTMSAPQGS